VIVVAKIAARTSGLMGSKSFSSQTIASPSIKHERTGSLPTAIAIKGKREEKSFPALVMAVCLRYRATPGPVSVFGTKRTWQSLSAMSAFGGKADILSAHLDVHY
jgi:hypothetical protein